MAKHLNMSIYNGTSDLVLIRSLVDCVGYVSPTPLIKSTHTLSGCDSLRQHVSTMKQNWEDIDIVQVEFS